MGLTFNPRLRGALMEVVENQLRDGSPPETSRTLARLVDQGHPREKALELIACIACSEIFDILRRNELYNEVRYVERLRDLPRMPWDVRSASAPPRAARDRPRGPSNQPSRRPKGPGR